MVAVCVGLLVVTAVAALFILYPWTGAAAVVATVGYVVQVAMSRPRRQARRRAVLDAQAAAMRERGFPEDLIAAWTSPPADRR